MNRRNFIKNTAYATAATQLPLAFWEKRDADVIILGAGISGLYAAYLLEKRGLKSPYFRRKRPCWRADENNP